MCLGFKDINYGTKVHIISGVTLCFEKGRVNKKKKGNKDGIRGGWVGSLIE